MKKITNNLLLFCLFLALIGCEPNTEIDNNFPSNNNTGNNNVENKDENSTSNEELEEPEKPFEYTYVDLGLTSGTKWGTTNLGAKKPEEIGGYYSWGELAPKDTFTHENYKWNDKNGVTKYCNYYVDGITDYKFVLEPEDDAATVTIGDGWHIPTKEQAEELKKECNWALVQSDTISGILISSKVNENCIFIPCSGYYTAQGFINDIPSAICWTSNMAPYYCGQAFAFYIGENFFNIHDLAWRYYGFTIRPVFNE